MKLDTRRPGTGTLSVSAVAEEPVDLSFIRDLPADIVSDLTLWDEILQSSFPAIAQLAPGLQHLTITVDWLDDEAIAVIADLRALETLQHRL